MGRVTVKVLKAAAGSVAAEEQKKAVVKAKFEVANTPELRARLVGPVIAQERHESMG